MVSADELATSGVREKKKKIKRIWEDDGESVTLSELEVVDLSREVAETKRNNSKLLDCNNHLIFELHISRTSKRLACIRVQKKEGCVQALEEHLAALDSKYSKTVEKLLQLVKEFCTRVSTLAAELKVEKDCVARIEENRMDERTVD